LYHQVCFLLQIQKQLEITTELLTIIARFLTFASMTRVGIITIY